MKAQVMSYWDVERKEFRALVDVIHVWFNQATVWTATGWHYRVSVAVGIGALFGVPLVLILLERWIA